MSIDSDYARVAAHLAASRLTPYVSYVARSQVDGIGQSKGDRIVVRVSDGKVVSHDSDNVDVEVSGRRRKSGNLVADDIFDPSCYRATSERATTFDRKAALVFSITPTCPDQKDEHDHPLTTLYADAQTFAPLAVEANGEDKYVHVDIDERYGEFEGRTMPISLHVDVAGTGLMFWLQVHVQQVFSDYEFLQKY